MAEEVIKKCDFPVGRGKNLRPHGVVIESGLSTKYRVEEREYLVDLCDEHRAALVEALQPFLDISRRASSALPRNARGRAIMRAKGGSTFTTRDVRTWLEENGREVPPSGRLPNALIDEYKAAHGLA